MSKIVELYVFLPDDEHLVEVQEMAAWFLHSLPKGVRRGTHCRNALRDEVIALTPRKLHMSMVGKDKKLTALCLGGNPDPIYMVSPSKLVTDWSAVTCKLCLKHPEAHRDDS
jgi:hypothetical protein